MIQILIADDHAIVREGLKQIVAEYSHIKVVGEAANAAELLHILSKESQWDLIILDINMPDKSGLEILKQIHTDYPQIPVLVLSMYDEEQYGMRALKAGASGYLQKMGAPDELVTAIEKIVHGGRYISPNLAEKMADSLNDPSASLPHQILSDREYQILCAIASGKSTDDIASALAISNNTVYTYRNRILEKMKMKSNVELTQYVIRHKLIIV